LIFFEKKPKIFDIYLQIIKFLDYICIKKQQQMYNTMTQNRQNRVKFSENLRVRSILKRGDRKKIAEKSGYKEGTIREMLNGYRQFTDEVKEAIIKLMSERQQLDKELEELVNQDSI